MIKSYTIIIVVISCFCFYFLFFIFLFLREGGGGEEKSYPIIIEWGDFPFELLFIGLWWLFSLF